MSSTIKDLNRSIYTSSTNDLYNSNVNNLHTIINKLIDDGKYKDILKAIVDYCNLNLAHKNIDVVTYILAYMVTIRKNEQLTNAAYTTLKDISDTPLYLFSFVSNHKYLCESEAKKTLLGDAKKYGKGWGKGQRKVITRWYNDHNEEDLLRLVTKHTHSHQWSHKDLIKMSRIKPANESFDVLFKYILFGYEKIQNNKPNDKLKVLYDFIRDKEELKNLDLTPEAVAVLIRKHKFHLEHLPVHLHRRTEVWEALVEDMNLQQFCSFIDVLIAKRLIKVLPQTQTEKHVLEKLLTNEKIIMSKISPLEPLVALQIYRNHKTTPHEGEQVPSDDTDLLQNCLLNAFKISIENFKLKSNKRILLVTAHDNQMKGGFSSYKTLRPIHLNACIHLCMLYGEENCDFVVLNDKVNEIKYPVRSENPSLKTIETRLTEVKAHEKCSNEELFKWLNSCSKVYDVIVYTMASNSCANQFLGDVEKFRNDCERFSHTRFAIVNLLNKTNPTKDNSKLNLILKTWNSDSFYLLQLFLNESHF